MGGAGLEVAEERGKQHEMTNIQYFLGVFEQEIEEKTRAVH